MSASRDQRKDLAGKASTVPIYGNDSIESSDGFRRAAGVFVRQVKMYVHDICPGDLHTAEQVSPYVYKYCRTYTNNGTGVDANADYMAAKRHPSSVYIQVRAFWLSMYLSQIPSAT